ncbi:MAG: S8 family peptidase [Actinomycetota bacterium]
MLSDRRFLSLAVRSRAVRLGAVLGVLALGMTAGPPHLYGVPAPGAAGALDPVRESRSSKSLARTEPSVTRAAQEQVDGSYIVTLEPGSDPPGEARGLAGAHGGRVRHVYTHALQGFSYEGSAESAADLARDPRVRSVVPDRPVAATAQTVPTGVLRVDGPLSGTASGDGSGSVDVDIAVLDTGIDVDHPDLNVVGGVNCSTGSGYDDDNGHGTHVAGTAAAIDDGAGVVGVAPGARLWAVRVLDSRGAGAWSSVICGIDWVTANASVIEVANMSLGGSGDAGHCRDGGLREAICRSVASGVTFAVAAGNESADVARHVPAAFPEVITVSALADFDGLPGGLGAATCRSDQDDTFADFSNHGDGVDLIAPGVCITSTWPGGGNRTISGTSMASPHVAGAAALYLSDHPGESPLAVIGALQAIGNLLWNPVGDPGGTKETLLNVDALAGTTIPGVPPPPTPPPPTEIALEAEGHRFRSQRWVDLTWSGASGPLDVFRNGALVIAATPNDGAQTDVIDFDGSGSYSYQVCQIDTGPCSNTVTVTF